MGFCFSKPNKKKILEESRELVEDNARMLSVCKELAPDKLRQDVDEIFAAVRYMTPTAAAGANQIDKKINALAGDLKIALSKGNERGLLQAEEIVRGLKISIAERNSFN